MKEWKKEAVEQLRNYDALCKAKETVERALATLTPENRMVLQLMDISPARGNGARLCDLLDCEIATVYRRRDKALRQFSRAMYRI